MKQLPLDMDPGPDGLTGQFCKSCWQIIKNDIMAAVCSKKLMGFSCLYTAYITLLSKKEDANNAKYFWPLSLVHCSAKLIAKLLANLKWKFIPKFCCKVYDPKFCYKVFVPKFIANF